MQSARRLPLILLLALLGLPLTGCVAVVAGAAGAGTVAWIQGRLDSVIDARFETVKGAAGAAISDLRLSKISEKQDGLTAVFVARTADDTRVEIKVAKIAEKATKVEIRVGLMGDKALSTAILDKIKANL